MRNTYIIIYGNSKFNEPDLIYFPTWWEDGVQYLKRDNLMHKISVQKGITVDDIWKLYELEAISIADVVRFYAGSCFKVSALLDIPAIWEELDDEPFSVVTPWFDPTSLPCDRQKVEFTHQGVKKRGIFRFDKDWNNSRFIEDVTGDQITVMEISEWKGL